MPDKNPTPADLPAAIDPQALDAIAASAGDAPQEVAAANEPPAIPTGQMLGGLLAMTFQIAAPNWDISEAEAKTLGDGYGAVMDKYFPNGLGNYGVEINALAITVMILGPRMSKPPKITAKPTKDEKKPADDKASPASLAAS